VMVQGKLNDKD